MLQVLPFNDHVAEYEAWFDKYPFVFRSEVMAIKELLPKEPGLRGLEVGTGTGRFAEAFGITDAVEPAPNMRLLAIKRGINVQDAEAENLPYHDLSFDYVLMAFCICYFDNLHGAFKEANRVIKQGGDIIVGLLDKESVIGKAYEEKKQTSVFYKHATFHSTEKIIEELKLAGFHSFEIVQTLFNNLDDIKELQPPTPGFGEGSFVVIKGKRK